MARGQAQERQKYTADTVEGKANLGIATKQKQSFCIFDFPSRIQMAIHGQSPGIHDEPTFAF